MRGFSFTFGVMKFWLYNTRNSRFPRLPVFFRARVREFWVDRVYGYSLFCFFRRCGNCWLLVVGASDFARFCV